MNCTQRILTSCLAVGFLTSQAVAVDSKEEARVTQIIRDVNLLPSDAAARPAVVNDKVKENTAVRTGGESRSELTFADLTITRLGANTIFSFNKAGHNAQLDSGSILLRVPKDSGGGFIRTSAVTVAVTGTTVIFEFSRAGKSKLIVLEGGAGAVLVRHPGQSQSVRAGQMLDVPAGATTLPSPTNIDLNQIMKTHPLITDFGPLPSRDLIEVAMKQADEEQPSPQKPADKKQPRPPQRPPDKKQPRLPQRPPDTEQPSPPQKPPDTKQPRPPQKPPDTEQPSPPQKPPDPEQPSPPQKPPDTEQPPPPPQKPPDTEQPPPPRKPPDTEQPPPPQKPPDTEQPPPPQKPPDTEQPPPPQKPTDTEQPPPPRKHVDKEQPPGLSPDGDPDGQ